MATVTVVSLQTGWAEDRRTYSLAVFIDSDKAEKLCQEFNQKFENLESEVEMEICGEKWAVDQYSELYAKALPLLG